MGVDNPGTLLRNDWRLCHSSSPCLLSVFVPNCDGLLLVGGTKGAEVLRAAAENRGQKSEDDPLLLRASWPSLPVHPGPRVVRSGIVICVVVNAGAPPLSPTAQAQWQCKSPRKVVEQWLLCGP